MRCEYEGRLELSSTSKLKELISLPLIKAHHPLGLHGAR
jgi:hypothetical protein